MLNTRRPPSSTGWRAQDCHAWRRQRRSVGGMKKFVAARPFADPHTAARKIVEIANGVEAVEDGRIYIERVNAPFLAAGRRLPRGGRARHRARLVMAARER